MLATSLSIDSLVGDILAFRSSDIEILLVAWIDLVGFGSYWVVLVGLVGVPQLHLNLSPWGLVCSF